MAEKKPIKSAGKTRMVPTNGETRGATPVPIVRVPAKSSGRATKGITPVPVRHTSTNKKK